MADVDEVKPTDPCPNCGAPLKAAPQATTAQRAKAAHREDPVPLPIHYDTATLEQIAEHGPLYRCTHCDWSIRLKGAAAA
jgi:predicted RNA-binding Zn-ribbon protein involved in translation (DUF1610 family)